MSDLAVSSIYPSTIKETNQYRKQTDSSTSSSKKDKETNNSKNNGKINNGEPISPVPSSVYYSISPAQRLDSGEQNFNVDPNLPIPIAQGSITDNYVPIFSSSAILNISLDTENTPPEAQDFHVFTWDAVDGWVAVTDENGGYKKGDPPYLFDRNLNLNIEVEYDGQEVIEKDYRIVSVEVDEYGEPTGAISTYSNQLDYYLPSLDSGKDGLNAPLVLLSWNVTGNVIVNNKKLQPNQAYVSAFKRNAKLDEDEEPIASSYRVAFKLSSTSIWEWSPEDEEFEPGDKYVVPWPDEEEKERSFNFGEYYDLKVKDTIPDKNNVERETILFYGKRVPPNYEPYAPQDVEAYCDEQTDKLITIFTLPDPVDPNYKDPETPQPLSQADFRVLSVQYLYDVGAVSIENNKITVLDYELLEDAYNNWDQILTQKIETSNLEPGEQTAVFDKTCSDLSGDNRLQYGQLYGGYIAVLTKTTDSTFEDSEIAVAETALYIEETSFSPQITDPSPRDGAINIDVNQNLSCSLIDPNKDIISAKLYYKKDTEPNWTEITEFLYSIEDINNGAPLIADLDDPFATNTNYQWKVEAQDDDGNVTISSIWNFKTGSTSGENQPPYKPESLNGTFNNTTYQIDLTYKLPTPVDPDQKDILDLGKIRFYRESYVENYRDNEGDLTQENKDYIAGLTGDDILLFEKTIENQELLTAGDQYVSVNIPDWVFSKGETLVGFIYVNDGKVISSAEVSSEIEVPKIILPAKTKNVTGAYIIDKNAYPEEGVKLSWPPVDKDRSEKNYLSTSPQTYTVAFKAKTGGEWKSLTVDAKADVEEVFIPLSELKNSNNGEDSQDWVFKVAATNIRSILFDDEENPTGYLWSDEVPVKPYEIPGKFDLLIAPNPFDPRETSEMYFVFNFDENISLEDKKITINIFDAAGFYVARIETKGVQKEFIWNSISQSTPINGKRVGPTDLAHKAYWCKVEIEGVGTKLIKFGVKKE